MNTEELNEQELSLLTDEERAGLVDDGDDGDDGNGDGDDGDDDGDDGTGGAADAGAAADDDKAKEAPAPGADDGAEGRDDGKDDDDDDAPAPRPAGDRVNADEVKTKLDDIATQKSALAEQLDEGEITTKEYTAAVDRLNDEKNDLSNKLTRQTEADDAIQQGWYKDVEKFLGKHKDISLNTTRLKSFDIVVRDVTADPENASLSNRKQLEKAHAIWKEEMGFTEQAKSKDEPKPAAKPASKPKPELPPTLHNVPAADINVGDDGKYSYLDALLNAGKTIEYEDALAKLPEAEQQDYLSRA